MNETTRLFVLFDGQCAMCSYARSWLQDEPQHVRLVFVDLHSARARRLWPDLHPSALAQQVHVLADDGRYWDGAQAWLMCLWATVAHRGKAIWLSDPARVDRAQSVVKALSARRHALSAWFGE